MHSRSVVAEALRLRDAEGLGARRVAARLGLPIGTVRDWYAGKLPRHSRAGAFDQRCARCGADPHGFSSLPPSYVYLLGLYLGDGCISAHPRGVHRLRIFLDLKYPTIVQACDDAISEVLPANKVNHQNRTSNYTDSDHDCDVEVGAYSKSLPCLFPQHGPGRKHDRRIWLSGWQQELAAKWPEAMLRGLIHSDGCRFTNTRGKADDWSAPRYSFSNLSTDLTSIFCTACDRLGLHWTAAFPKNERNAAVIYVSRKADVARMDEFIGPKA